MLDNMKHDQAYWAGFSDAKTGRVTTAWKSRGQWWACLNGEKTALLGIVEQYLRGLMAGGASVLGDHTKLRDTDGRR